MEIKINEEGISKRIDKYLSETTDYTRSKIKKMMENDNILVNNKKVKISYTLKLNDVITINEVKEKLDLIPENIKLDIVYEDEDVIVVNKKSGMVVHPAPGHYSKTLVNALLYHCNTLSNNDIRPGIVHRIDKDTSGLLMVAKNDFAHEKLSEQLRNKTSKRKYIALVKGIVMTNSGTIDAPIGRDVNNRQKMAVTDINGKESVTHFKVLERYKDATLIECILETGRTHQIRVHMEYINHPIINDPVYNSKKKTTDFGQMLHAKTLGFINPKTNEYMEFVCQVPKEFNEILNKFKG